MGYFNFEEDFKASHVTEVEILKIIQKKYPKAYLSEGICNGFDIYIPEVNQTLEVKRDFIANYRNNENEYGEFCIEIACRGKPSGIETTQSDWYVLVSDQFIIFIFTEELKKLIENLPEKVLPAIGKDGERVVKYIKTSKLIFCPYASCLERKV